MADRIVPRLVRGRLYFLIGNVYFFTLSQAMAVLSAANCHRLDIAEVRHA